MKVKKILNPQRTISDLIKQMKTNIPQEQKKVLNSQINEIKQELKSSDPKTLMIALQKLFLLKMEGVDMSQLDFLIVNSLSCNQFKVKRMACLQIPVSIDPTSQSLFMATNLFKKELMKPNQIEVSCTLSCITNIVTIDMGPILIEDAIKILKNSNPQLRKKAMALVAKIFLICPQTIQGNLETILDQIISKEVNQTVLACFTSVVNSVLNVQQKLFPLFVKPLYELIQNNKQNWLTIKLIKTFHKMIKLEPRLIKKLQEVYSSLLTTTNSKALEYELLDSVIEFFKDDSSLYDLACEKLKFFIEHSDANLQSLGFNLLNKMVITNPVMITQYKSFLIETLDGTTDIYTKLQILDIFENFIEVVLKQIVLDSSKGQRKSQSISISCIIATTKANDYEFIADYDWLIQNVISCLSKNVLSTENAIEIQSLIYDLMVRIDGLSSQIFQLSYQVLSDLSNQMLNSNTQAENQMRMNGKFNQAQSNTYPITAQEIIFQTYMFIIGEFSQHMKDYQEIEKLFGLLNNIQLLKIFNLSSNEIQATLLKCIVKYSKRIGQKEKFDEIERLIQLAIEILVKSYKINGNNFNLDINQNILLKIIDPSDENLANLLNKIPIKVEQQMIEKIQQLNQIFVEFEPIHPDAQKYVAPVEGIDLTVIIQKSSEEIDKLAARCKEFLSVQGIVKQSQDEVSEQNQQQNEQEQQNQTDDQSQQASKKEDILDSQMENIKPDPVPTKQYTVKKFQELPSNNINNNIQNQNETEYS